MTLSVLSVSIPLMADIKLWPLMLAAAVLTADGVFLYIRRQNAQLFAKHIDYEELASILKADKLYRFFNSSMQLPEDEYVADNIVDEYSDEFKNAFDPEDDKYPFDIEEDLPHQ